MKTSYKWLQTYFEEKLPEPKALEELLTFHAFEIESVEAHGDDTVLDVKVLPDRAHYALSHRGVAYEISAIIGKKRVLKDNFVDSLTNMKVKVTVEDKEACPRYVARMIEEITVGESPEWLKTRLESVGQRSINSVVDAANFVMLDMGQPLHAFDADKVHGGISVRYAKLGEMITTLDQKEIKLDESILVIADEKGPLAIAGIKGGTRAAVTEKTTNIIIESANFKSSLIRKTGTKIGIRTDASKRYENGVPASYTIPAIDEMTSLIVSMSPTKKIGPLTDISSIEEKPKILTVTASYISDLIGRSIPEKDIQDILTRLLFKVEAHGDEFTITIPEWRKDITISQDLVEEVARIYGLEKISALSLPPTAVKPAINKFFYYSNKIRDILTELGFSEVYTYALKSEGQVGILNPLASDKGFLREWLLPGQVLIDNARNADFLGLDQIKIFEIGTVFKSDKETIDLSLGVKNVKKSKIKPAAILRETLKKIGDELGKEIQKNIDDNLVITELDLTSYIESLPTPEKDSYYKPADEKVIYKQSSPYPFAVRDIAVFVPQNITEQSVRNIILDEAGDLLLKDKLRLFDVFTKPMLDGTMQTSYAFRLIFQSPERTLTEEEINAAMNRVTEKMNRLDGWQVR